MRTIFKNAFLIVICSTFLLMISAGLVEFRVQAQTPAFDKSNFHDPLKIDNKYYPLKVGTIMSYNGTDEDGKPVRDIVTVTNDSRDVQGIPTRVVNDTVFGEGKIRRDY